MSGQVKLETRHRYRLPNVNWQIIPSDHTSVEKAVPESIRAGNNAGFVCRCVDHIENLSIPPCVPQALRSADCYVVGEFYRNKIIHHLIKEHKIVINEL